MNRDKELALVAFDNTRDEDDNGENDWIMIEHLTTQAMALRQAFEAPKSGKIVQTERHRAATGLNMLSAPSLAAKCLGS